MFLIKELQIQSSLNACLMPRTQQISENSSSPGGTPTGPSAAAGVASSSGVSASTPASASTGKFYLNFIIFV